MINKILTFLHLKKKSEIEKIKPPLFQKRAMQITLINNDNNSFVTITSKNDFGMSFEITNKECIAIRQKYDDTPIEQKYDFTMIGYFSSHSITDVVCRLYDMEKKEFVMQ